MAPITRPFVMPSVWPPWTGPGPWLSQAPPVASARLAMPRRIAARAQAVFFMAPPSCDVSTAEFRGVKTFLLCQAVDAGRAAGYLWALHASPTPSIGRAPARPRRTRRGVHPRLRRGGRSRARDGLSDEAA